MRTVIIRIIPLSLAVALLIAPHAGLFAAAAHDTVSDVSALAAAPSSEPAYFSEVAPSVLPAPPDTRPRSSAYAMHGASAWPKLFGATLALGGLFFVFLALRMRPENDG